MKKSLMKNPAMIIMFIVFALYSFTIVFVIFQGISFSLMTPGEYSDGALVPKTGLILANYVDAFSRVVVEKTNLLGMTLNSLWFAGGSSFFGILFSTITAYVIAKYKFPGRGFLYGWAIVTMMLPIMGSSAASIKFYKSIGILDTNFMIVMFASSYGQNFVIQYATYKGISWEYAEAAFIDGANHFKVWVEIMIPQAISTMVALFVVSFIGKWSDSDTALLFMKTHPTLASGLYVFSHRNSYHKPIQFAGFMIGMIPVLALYIGFQRTIMDIQIGGGLKG
jgi:raffinose/stachyose/melibiose transport system permease protein/N-acetylglucosamine transport system permease protein